MGEMDCFLAGVRADAVILKRWALPTLLGCIALSALAVPSQGRTTSALDPLEEVRSSEASEELPSPLAQMREEVEQSLLAANPRHFSSAWRARMASAPAVPMTDEPWTLQVMPSGLIYRSYLAGVKEPRFASQWVHEAGTGWIWDIALGGRVGILRYGTEDALLPDGWQLDMEGAGLPRLDLVNQCDLVAADFRFGIPLTYGRGPFRMKFGYYHLSSHLGDEYMIKHPDAERINYSRDALIWGNSYYMTRDLRLYAEAAWAFQADGGAKPWEFQFGIDYSPMRPSHLRGDPFLALNAHLREDVNFGGNMVLQTGWQWRGETGHLFRVGMHYFAGKSEQFEFYNQHEKKIGFGLWYDY